MRVYDKNTLVTIEQLQLDLNTISPTDKQMIHAYIDELKSCMIQDWKYGSSWYEIRQLNKLLSKFNAILLKYDKRIE
jgi:hypothetical protein